MPELVRFNSARPDKAPPPPGAAGCKGHNYRNLQQAPAERAADDPSTAMDEEEEEEGSWGSMVGSPRSFPPLDFLREEFPLSGVEVDRWSTSTTR